MIQAIKSQNLLQKICQTTKGKYKQGDTIKFETETIKSSLCDYSDTFILVTGNITVAVNNNTDVAFKNCTPFSTCITKIGGELVDEANHIYIAMPLYNLIEYSDNHSNTSGSLWQFQRDKVPADNADLSINNSQSFKYKAALLGKKQMLLIIRVLAYSIPAPPDDNTPADDTAGVKNNKKYFLRRGEIKNYNVLIAGRNFHDQPINDLIKQYDEIRNVAAGYGDDYTTGCLLDYAYLKDNYRLIAVDLSKQKFSDADPRAIQQIIFRELLKKMLIQKEDYTLFLKNLEYS